MPWLSEHGYQTLFFCNLALFQAKRTKFMVKFSTEGDNKSMLTTDDWVRQLADNYSLDEALVRRLNEEFLAFTDVTVQDYVVREHLRLQARKLRNSEIFARLREEVSSRRFRIEAPTERQLRRWIYG